MSKRIKRAAVCLLLVLLVFSLVLSVIFLGRGNFEIAVGADTGDGVTWSNEDYYRMLYLNGLEERHKKSTAMENLDFSHPNQINYTQQGGNMWSYVSIGLRAVSIMTSFLTPWKDSAEKALKVISVGLGAGANATLRNSIMEKMGSADAEMLETAMQEISQDFSKLSAQINKQTADLQDSIAEATNLLADKVDLQSYTQKLNTFYANSGLGPFLNKATSDTGYTGWLNALRGAFNMATSQSASRSDFDNLYFLAERTSVLHDAIVGGQNISDESILETFYRYCLLASQKAGNAFNMDTYLLNCVQFGEELFFSYLYGNACLEFAYAYQMMNMENNKYIPSSGSSVNLESIENYYEKLPEEIIDVERELIDYYTRVLNLDGVYTINTQNRMGRVSYYQVTDSPIPGSQPISIATGPTGRYFRKHVSVPTGATLYLENLPKSLTDNMMGTFFFKSSDPTLAEVSENGVVTVKGTSGNFSVSLNRTVSTGEDEDVTDEIYRFDFVIGTEAFSGGIGTEDLPYFISSVSDLRTLASNSSYWAKEFHYLLTDDLSLSGQSLSCIGNENTAFAGTFDGGCHTLRSKSGAPLFGTVTGTVENLILNSFNITSYRQNVNQFYGGILCYENGGVLENCHILSSKVSASLYAATTGSSYYTTDSMYFGAVGFNKGTLENCSAVDVTVSVTFDSKIGSSLCYPEPYCYAGALVGHSDSNSVLRDCLAYSSEVYAHLKNRSKVTTLGKDKLETTAHFYLGGMAGTVLSSSTAERCVAYGNNVHRDWTPTLDDSSGLTWFGKIHAYEDPHLGTLWGTFFGEKTLCFEGGLSDPDSDTRDAFTSNGWDLSNTSAPKLKNNMSPKESVATSIEVTNPTQTVYYVGDPLNLAGLFVTTNTGAELRNYNVQVPDEVTNPDTAAKGESDYDVTVSWNDLSSSFKVTMQCPHKQFAESSEILGADCTHVIKRVKRVCDTCGEEFYNFVELDSTGSMHNFDQGVVTVEPTYEQEGERTFTCQNEDCGFQKKETIPKLVRHIISLSSGSTVQGGAVIIDVSITGNPDLLQASIKVGFDPEALELVDVSNTGTLKGTLSDLPMGNYHLLTWDNNAGEPNAQNGIIVQLTFRAKQDFAGETEIEVMAGEGFLSQSFEDVEFEYKTARVKVEEFIKGDINGDKAVNTVDLAYLKRHIAGWEAFRDIDPDVADLNSDGVINMVDVVILRRFIANWEGVTL